jgi:hypothetical protein
MEAYEEGYRARVAGQFIREVEEHYQGRPLDKSSRWFNGFHDAEDDLRWRAQGVEQMQFGL